ncbi:hypothetical protein RvY_02858 [Ramazzottius varieornatus]|uniref:Uncharacterized protein n=1 Tax=Ramazzottius varieornatus TaxID=947166 RepID=A0A1D1UL66_RAMVA|nr:hypothetical protein RvY_02858 [Ramazzottius varieornatus]
MSSLAFGRSRVKLIGKSTISLCDVFRSLNRLFLADSTGKHSCRAEDCETSTFGFDPQLVWWATTVVRRRPLITAKIPTALPFGTAFLVPAFNFFGTVSLDTAAGLGYTENHDASAHLAHLFGTRESRERFTAVGTLRYRLPLRNLTPRTYPR